MNDFGSNNIKMLFTLKFRYKFVTVKCTVNLLKFCTPKCLINWHLQTVQTQITLLLKEQPDLGLHCLLFH